MHHTTQYAVRTSERRISPISTCLTFIFFRSFRLRNACRCRHCRQSAIQDLGNYLIYKCRKQLFSSTILFLPALLFSSTREEARRTHATPDSHINSLIVFNFLPVSTNQMSDFLMQAFVLNPLVWRASLVGDGFGYIFET